MQLLKFRYLWAGESAKGVVVVNKLLLPLETMITSTVNAINNLMSKEGEKKFEASSSGQGQALIQSFHLQLQEVCPVLTNLVPMLLITVKDLHETLTRLARTASFDAGVLHKAFEAVGESQDTSSQEIQIAREDIDEVETLPVEKQKDIMENILHHDRNGDFLMDEEMVLHDEEDSWISPPDSMDSGSFISDDACRDSQCERSPSSISFEHKTAYQTTEMVDSDSVGSEKNQSAFNFQPCLTLSQENTSLRSDSYGPGGLEVVLVSSLQPFQKALESKSSNTFSSTFSATILEEALNGEAPVRRLCLGHPLHRKFRNCTMTPFIKLKAFSLLI